LSIERNRTRDENVQKKPFSRMGVLASSIVKKAGKALLTAGTALGFSACVPEVTINNIPMEDCSAMVNECGTTTTVHLREEGSTAGQNHVNVENGVLRMTDLDRDADPDVVSLEFGACGEVDGDSIESGSSTTLSVKDGTFTVSASVREDPVGVVVDVSMTSACSTGEAGSTDAGSD
jgi:hypothetical protein